MIGGGDTAAEDATYLAGLCRKVYMVHRRDQLRASQFMQKKVFATNNIEMVWNHIPLEILGEGDKFSKSVTGLRLQNVQTKAEQTLAVDGVFVAIGHHPNTELFEGQLELDEEKYIVTQPGTSKTSVPGVFAAGDVQDFYQYACGGWMKMHPLGNEYARYGSFDQLAEDNLAQLKSLIFGLAQQNNKPGSLEDKISILYNMGMDSAACDLQGSEPIRNDLKHISAIKNLPEIGKEAAKLSLYISNPFMTISGEANPHNSNQKIAWAWQSGLGIGDRDYYTEKKFQEVRMYYTEMIANLLEHSNYSYLAGFHGKELQMADRILEFETQMAMAFMSKEEMRIPEKTVHIMSVKEWEKMVPNLNIPEYLSTLRLEIDSINVVSPDYFKALNEILKSTDIQTLKAYLAWTLIRSASPYLSNTYANAHFDFYGKILSGKKEQQIRWKRVIRTVDACMGDAVGQMYVKTYFPENARIRMEHMVKNLQEALKERIMQSVWMSDTTKQAAISKLASFRVKIGYPDKWRSYDNLKLDGQSYWENIPIRNNRTDRGSGQPSNHSHPTMHQPDQTVQHPCNPSGQHRLERHHHVQQCHADNDRSHTYHHHI